MLGGSLLKPNNRGIAWKKKQQYDKAIKDYDEALRLDPTDSSPFCGRACCFALQGKTDLAIENLGKALALGYKDFEYIEKDSELDSIRDDPRYKKLLAKYKK